MTEPWYKLVRIRYIPRGSYSEPDSDSWLDSDHTQCRVIWHKCSLFPVEFRPLEFGEPHPDFWPCPNYDSPTAGREISITYAVLKNTEVPKGFTDD